MGLIISEETGISFSLACLREQICENHEHAAWQQRARKVSQGHVEVWRVLQRLDGEDDGVRRRW